MNSPTLGSLKTVEALPLAQRTAAVNGSAVNAYYVKDDPVTGAWIGWFQDLAIFVNQTAGSGNNGGNYLQVTVQGRIDSDHAWATLPQSADIKITENAATGYYARVEGPILPELRVAVSETGTADATFEVHLALQSD